MEFRTVLSATGGSVAVVSCFFPSARALAHELSVELVASGFSNPIALCSPPGDFQRLFVVEQLAARIRIVSGGIPLPTPFLDLDDVAGEGLEDGLLGLAFHPEYARNGRFFVNYTDDLGNTQVVEYAVSDDPDVADPNPVQTIFTQVQPSYIHKGGNLTFGPDGMLYIGLGDGGEQSRAQDGSSNLGKMLRLDVGLPPPFVPPDNPFLDDPSVNDEIWALGLRNPWRYSFDRLTGDLYIADVGQHDWEEIDLQPASSTGGENYGWRCMEASECTGLSDCSCADGTLVLPLHEYPHWAGDCAVIGGFVYRGSAIPWFQGNYVLGDYCTSRIWSFREQDGQVTHLSDRTAELEPEGTPTIDKIFSFGEDGAGELYVLDPSGGEVYRIVGSCEGIRYCRSEVNSTGSRAVIDYSGSSSISADEMALLAALCPPNQSGHFLYGPAQVDVPFGNGRQCIGAGDLGLFVLRPAVHVSASGAAIRRVHFTEPPMDSGTGRITPGSTWNFQFWFRDSAAGGAGSNTTDALSILFCL